MDDLESQFTFQVISSGAAMRLSMENAYLADWNPTLAFFNKHFKNGIIDWEIDLRKAGQISSAGLGALIAFNTKCLMANGSFKIIVQSDSHIRKMLFHTKLDSIIAIDQGSTSDFHLPAEIMIFPADEDEN